MVTLNPHFKKLKKNYLFLEIEKKVQSCKEKTPQAEFMNLGIGDITSPLVPTVVDAICKATKEMGKSDSIRGYGPSEGYHFLRKAIQEGEYKNLPISESEIFVSNGSKNDCANIQEIFDIENIIGIADPIYPVYIDSNVMAGRAKNLPESEKYKNFTYFSCIESNNFSPIIPDTHCDLIYLCSPNNPTGIAMTKAELKKWVDYAIREKAIILYDAAYSAFITSEDVPRSIYEIENADTVAIEFKSFSKTAGFTGLRCSYTIVPKNIMLNNISLHSLWKRRMESKYGGTAYPIQRGAEAVFSVKGQEEIKTVIANYLKNASFLKKELIDCGYTVHGGVDSPYLWIKTPHKFNSWDFFDKLLEQKNIISIPGRGFGSCGEGFVRLSCFAKTETIQKAAAKLKDL